MKLIHFGPVFLLLAQSVVSKIPTFNPACYAFYDSTSLNGSIPTQTTTISVTVTHTRSHCTNGKTTFTPEPHTIGSHERNIATTAPITDTYYLTHRKTVYNHPYTRYSHKTTSTTTYTFTRTATLTPTTTTTIATRSGFVPIGSVDTRFAIGSSFRSGSFVTSVTCTSTKSITTYATKLCDVFTYTASRSTVTVKTSYYTYTVAAYTTTVDTGSTYTRTVRLAPATSTGTTTIGTYLFTTKTVTNPNQVATEYAMCNDPANYARHYQYNSTKLLPFYSVFQSDHVDTLVFIENSFEYAETAKECCELCASEKNCAGAVWNPNYHQGLGIAAVCATLTSGKTCRTGEKQWYGIASLDFQDRAAELESWTLINGPCGRGGNILMPQVGCGNAERCSGFNPECIFDVGDCQLNA